MSPFLKAVGASFIAGIMIVIVASAFSCSGGAAQASPAPAIHPAIASAEAACGALLTAGAEECIVQDFNPSLEIIANVSAPEARVLCEAMARFVSAHYKPIAGKNWKVRVFRSGEMPPTDSCRVR